MYFKSMLNEVVTRIYCCLRELRLRNASHTNTPSMAAALNAAFGMGFGRPVALLASGSVSSRWQRTPNLQTYPTHESARARARPQNLRRRCPLAGHLLMV